MKTTKNIVLDAVYKDMVIVEGLNLYGGNGSVFCGRVTAADYKKFENTFNPTEYYKTMAIPKVGSYGMMSTEDCMFLTLKGAQLCLDTEEIEKYCNEKFEEQYAPSHEDVAKFFLEETGCELAFSDYRKSITEKDDEHL